MTRDQILAEITPGLPFVPEHLCGGLVGYFVARVRPGNFLQALLRNDLREAVLRADRFSLLALRELVWFLENHAPGGSFGSPEAVEAWLAVPVKAEP